MGATKVVKDKKCEFDFDPILQDIGEFGRYQIYNYILIVIPIAIYAGITLTYAFTAGNVTYRCNVPQCDVNATDYNADWVKNAIPQFNHKPAICSRYAPNSTVTLRLASNFSSADDRRAQCDAPTAFDHSRIERCSNDDLIYETDELTIVNAFGLTCEENEWKIAAIGTVNNFALLLFLPIMGVLSDRYGRRTVFIWSMFLCGFFGIFKAFAISYPMFLTMEFVEAGLGAGSFIGAYVIGMELLGPNKRALGGALIMCFDGVGHVVLGFLAMFTRNFRIILLGMHVPAMFFVSYRWLLPESNRWLMTNGRKAEAVRNIQRAARVNGVELSDEHKRTLADFERSDARMEERATATGRISQRRLSVAAGEVQKLVRSTSIWKSRVMVLRLLNACFAWFVVVFVDYGLTLNSVNLGGDKYMNFILSTLMEIPANVLMFVIMNFFGRRNSQSGSMLICGICCFAAEYGGAEGSVFRLTMNLIGKYAISTSFAILYMYTAELFPTCIRNGAMSASSMFGRVGSMVVPQLPLLARYWPALPMVVFGLTSFASGLCVLFLPETSGTRLPDTIEEAEQLGKERKLTGAEQQHQSYVESQSSRL